MPTLVAISVITLTLLYAREVTSPKLLFAFLFKLLKQNEPVSNPQINNMACLRVVCEP